MIESSEPTQQRLLTSRFVPLLVAQACSLLGLEILQFVLPLHLLNLTGSGAIFGGVLAAGFVPYIGLSPIGGMLADRTRKRGVMIACDVLLALAMACYLVLSAAGEILISVTVIVLMMAFAAQALYHPCVQSALPLVVDSQRVTQAVAVANQVSMITGIAGPVIGGFVFGLCGMSFVVALSVVAFALSALLTALFVRISYEPPRRTEGILATAKADVRDAFEFLRSRSILWQAIITATLVNLFGSSFITVGIPYVVTETLDFSSQFVAIAQGALAIGGLMGGAVVAIKPNHFGIAAMPRLLALATGGLALISLVLGIGGSRQASFVAIAVGDLWVMACCTALSIAVTSYLQRETPATLVGKVMAFAMMAANCATPAGQMAYGVIFDFLPAWVAAALTAIVMLTIATCIFRVRQRDL